jgi:protein-S-isoprenylcysteine O-methyltransferase Ste14
LAAAAVPAAAAVSLALPALGSLAAACTLPTCLGFWKGAYAVSYGYGGAMLASGLLILQTPGVVGLAQVHALTLAAYGFRLNAFLLYRELALPEALHQMKRKDATLVQRLKRLPLILGCSGLYFCMAAPLCVTALAASQGLACPVTGGARGLATGGCVVCLGLTFLGFGVAAIGDFVKTWVKAREGPDTLVTAGPFKRLRHPNYTGECFGWAASCAASGCAAVSAGFGGAAALFWLGLSVVGTAGIIGILAGEATAGLEKKQEAKYGSSPVYQKWIKGSWSGPMFGSA